MSSQKKNPKAKPHSLLSVARRELGVKLDKEHQTSDWTGELSSAMLEYAAMDAQVPLPLAEVLEAKVVDAGLEKVSDIERRALPATAWMQNAGVPFDVEGWKEYLKQVEDNVNRLKEKLAELASPRPSGEEWNWRSPQQIMQVFALEGIKLPNTREATILRYDHPLAKLLVEYKKAYKMVSSFGPNLLKFVQEDDRIYSDWRQIGTETGRMSCSKPNLRQLPPEVRRCVRAPDGRTSALIAAFRAGKDPYEATAASMYSVPGEEVTKEQRAASKVVNFSFIFGASAYGIARKLDITEGHGSRLVRRYFAAHRQVETFLKETVQKALDTGEARTLTGRIRRFGDVSLMSRKDAGGM